MFLKSLFMLLLVALLATLCHTTNAACTTDDLRIYGSNPKQGLLQICKSNQWYSVCGSSWSCSDARVACRQLGFTGPLAYYGHCCGYFGTVNPRDNRRWYCSYSSTLTKLASCSYGTSSLCTYSSSYYYRPAGIRCNSLTTTASTCSPDGSIRLQSGADEYEGRLEVCYGGQWSSVCNLDVSDASVACQQLGHSQYASVFTTGFGSSEATISTMNCQSTYKHLNECTINGYSTCTTSSTVSVPSCSRAIRCSPQPTELCPEGSVRLAGGDIEQEGRVEVCFGGIWGTICPNGWGAGDAYVACRSLGYDPGIAPSLLSNQFGKANGTIVFNYVNCQGYESSLAQCSKQQYPSLSLCYGTNNYAEVRCYEDCSNGDVRITGGLTDSEGTVEVCRGNLWGLVSEVGWNDKAAKVVCRQLGLGTQDAIAVSNSNYMRPRKSVHYINMTCTGAEDQLLQCAKTSISLSVGKTTYKTDVAAAVSCHGYTTTKPPCVPPSPPSSVSVCTNGTVRLMGGQTSAEGRLEYCYNGQWSPFCTLRSQEATVACNQLGYTHYKGAAVMMDGRFGSVSNYSLFQNITCSNLASETSLQNCQVNPAVDCLPFCPSIGIRCYTPGTCDEGAIRLADGFIPQEGRVEVCMNGVWGSVCDQSWDKTDALIICQQLSYAELEPVAYHNSYFGEGNGPILYSNVSCGGYENNFGMCPKNEFLSFSCSRGQTAGLLCGEQCNDGDLRLSGGSSNMEGTVEICFGNLWGLVADSGWTDVEASVVCKQLGFSSQGAMSQLNSKFGKPNKPIQANYVSCTGGEAGLAGCTMTTYGLETGKMVFNNVDVAGVSCQVYSSCMKPPSNSNACTNDSIRLSGGSVSNEGRLEYCYQGTWTPFCSVSPREATVACRQLGYTSYDMASVFTDGRFSTPMNYSYFQSVTCSSGTEFQLKDCDLDDSCSTSCSSTIGIRCYDSTTSCTAGSLQLVGGAVGTMTGRVEVCLNGVWGTICADGWGTSDAFVTCKQLGVGEGRPTAITNSSMFGEGTGPVVYSNVLCDGWESNILECPRSLYGTFQCLNRNAAGVTCRDACADDEVRLSNGTVATEGTVEICYDSLWRLVAATNWVDRNAAVVCRQLGIRDGSEAQAVVGSKFGKTSRFVRLSDVQCSGTESKLADCTATNVDQSSDSVDVAGVVCTRPSPMTPSTSTPVKATTPTPTSDRPTADASSLTAQVPLFAVVGIFAVILIVGLIVIIILVVVLIMSSKNANYEDKEQLITGTVTNQNPAFGSDQDSEFGNDYGK